MCNVSMEQKICRQQDGIKMVRLHKLVNRTTNLSNQWLRTLEHNYFQTCWKLSERKTFNNYLCNISIDIRI